MKRRSFLAAVAPIMALSAPAMTQAQAPAAPAQATPANAPLPEKSPAQKPKGATSDAPGAKDAKRKAGPTEITAQEAMLDNKSNLAVFSGLVDVKSPEYNINCDKLTVYLKKAKGGAAEAAPKTTEARPIGADEEPVKKDGDSDKPAGQSSGGIDTAIAEGNVRIMQEKPAAGGGKPEKYFATGRKAVFDNAKQTCTLTGWPRVQQSIGQDLAREIVPLEESCVIVMSPDRIEVSRGRHTTRIIDIDALGSGQKKEGGAAKPSGLLPGGL